jgi:hypothetical protein
MSKYEPLWSYIRDHKPEQLTFSEIETILRFSIDHSFLNAKKELIEYGYAVEKISMKQQLIRIGRLKTKE